MRGPHLERTASLITVPPASGKFFYVLGLVDSAECNAEPPLTEYHTHKLNRHAQGRVHQHPNSPGDETPPPLTKTHDGTKQHQTALRDKLKNAGETKTTTDKEPNRVTPRQTDGALSDGKKGPGSKAESQQPSTNKKETKPKRQS